MCVKRMRWERALFLFSVLLLSLKANAWEGKSKNLENGDERGGEHRCQELLAADIFDQIKISVDDPLGAQLIFYLKNAEEFYCFNFGDRHPIVPCDVTFSPSFGSQYMYSSKLFSSLHSSSSTFVCFDDPSLILKQNFLKNTLHLTFLPFPHGTDPMKIPSDVITPSQLSLQMTTTAIYEVFVNNLVDSKANKTFCNPSFPQSTSLCNLRSSISYCVSLFSTTPYSECIIYLPASSTLQMDVTLLGHIYITSFSGTLNIIGGGNLIIPKTQYPSFKFLRISSSLTARSYFKLSNVTLSYFGGISVLGGVMELFGLSSMNFEAVLFKNNIGASGGALYLSSVKNVTILQCLFQDHLVQSNGGAVAVTGAFEHYLIEESVFDSNFAQYGNGGGWSMDGSGYNIIFLRSNFTSNKAQYGLGGGLYGGGLNEHITYLHLYFFNNSVSQKGGGLYIGTENQNILINSTIFLQNIAMYGGAVAAFSKTYLVSIENTQFLHNSATYLGGGLYFGEFNSNSTIINCQFLSNQATYAGGGMVFENLNEDVLISHVTFIDNYAGSYGGAILLIQSNSFITITHCSFLSNIGSSAGGGGIYLDQFQDTVTIKSSFFHQNFGDVYAGSLVIYQTNYRITIRDCVFSNDQGYFGGSLYLSSYNRDITLTNCSFLHNSAALSGGAIYLTTMNSDVQINSCLFMNNSGIYGGAITITQINQFVTISHCQFSQNNAPKGYGGALLINEDNYDLFIQDSIFDSNHAGYLGGAISSLISNSYLFISGCHFIGNSATSGGAVNLHIGNTQITLLNNQFHSNSAVTYGGGCYLNYRIVIFNISGNSFEKNSASYGGAVALESQNMNGILINNNYTMNTALLNGAGIFIKDSNYGIKIYDSHFLENKSQSYGAAISLLSSNPFTLIHSCSFIKNTATTAGGSIHSSLLNSNLLITSCTFLSSLSTYGGAIFIGEDHRNISILSTQFIDCYSHYGGGIYLTQFNEDILIDSSEFLFNMARHRGGAIEAMVNGLVITHTIFQQNYAPSVGGLYLYGNDITILYSSFINNSAMETVGGIYFKSSSFVIIKSSVFAENSGAHGGALSYDQCQFGSITNCTFLSNIATLQGGAIHTSDVSQLLIELSLFQSNSAIEGGGIFSINDLWGSYNSLNFYQNKAITGGGLKAKNSYVMMIENTLFQENLGNGSYAGSALWLTSSSTSLWNNTFLKNSAPHGGGTVFWESFSEMTEPEYLFSKNSFEKNEAVYGSKAATEGVQLFLPYGKRYNITDYHSRYSPMVLVQLYDLYNQHVLIQQSNGLAQVSILPSYLSPQLCYDGTGYLTGGIVEPMINGRVNLSTLEAYCAPNYELGLDVTIAILSAGQANELSSTFSFHFRNCQIGEYYENKVCRICPNGTYSLHENSQLEITTCQRCPSSASACFGNQIRVRDGYWRMSERSETILSCPYRSCQSGWGVNEDLCKEGHEGPLCAVCSHNYYYDSTRLSCMRCDDSHALESISFLLFLLLSLLILISLIVIYRIYRLNKVQIHRTGHSVDTHTSILVLLSQYLNLQSSSSSSSSSSLTQTSLWGKFSRWKKAIQARLKIYLVFYQIISSLPFVLDLSYPSVYSAIVSPFSFFNLRISDSSATSCSVMRYDYIDHLIVDTLYPLGTCLCLFFLYLLHMTYLTYFSQGTTTTHTTAASTSSRAFLHRKRSISSYYLTVLIMFLYVCLPGISTSIFRTYPCQDVDPDNSQEGESEYMRSDYSISCSSDRYLFGVYWATVMIIIYPIGVPLLFFCLLYRQKEAIINRPHLTSSLSALNYDEPQSQPQPQPSSLSPSSSLWKSNSSQDSEIILRPLRVLYASYVPTFWYWEIFETYFRLLLTGFLVLVSQGSTLQIIIGILNILLFLQLYNSYQPYLNKSYQFLKTLTIWQVYFVLFISLLLRCDVVQRSNPALAVVIVLVILMSFLYDFIGLMITWVRESYGEWWTIFSVASTADQNGSRRGTGRGRSVAERKLICSELKKQNEVTLEMKRTQEKLSVLETISREISMRLQELSGDVEEKCEARSGNVSVASRRTPSRSISNPLREVETISLGRDADLQ